MGVKRSVETGVSDQIISFDFATYLRTTHREEKGRTASSEMMQKWAVKLEINAWINSRFVFFPLDQTSVTDESGSAIDQRVCIVLAVLRAPRQQMNKLTNIGEAVHTRKSSMGCREPRTCTNGRSLSPRPRIRNPITGSCLSITLLFDRAKSIWCFIDWNCT